MDANKVLPAYVESIAKLKYDQPAVRRATELLGNLPDKNVAGEPNRLKNLAQWYIKNYSRYDAMPGLSEAWNNLSSKLMRTTGRSMMGLNTGLQTLHLARIPANLWPELPSAHLARAAKEVAMNPAAALKEAKEMGLMQGDIRPWNFKTKSQKLDSIFAMGNFADFLDRSIGFKGFKQMYMQQGMNESEATMKAIASSKRASLLVDPARATMGFTPDAKLFGGAAGRLATQFKQVPVKIIEQYLSIAARAKQDPKAAARMVAGIGMAIGATEYGGLRAWHVAPSQLAVQAGGATGQVIYNIYKSLAKGDVYGALKKTALWATPGGMSVERQLRRGLSMFERSNEQPTQRP